MEYEIYHHGIKGMKWGVRKDRKNGRSRRPTMVDYSPEVTKKFGRKGPKIGPTDSAIGRAERFVNSKRMRRLLKNRLSDYFSVAPLETGKQAVYSSAILDTGIREHQRIVEQQHMNVIQTQQMNMHMMGF